MLRRAGSGNLRQRCAQWVASEAFARLAAVAAIIAAAVLASGAALVACDFPVPRVSPGVEVRCTADSECTEAGKAVCDLAAPEQPVCVQCTPQKAGACMGTTPVCGAANKACRGCLAHAECTASAVCEPAGSCADAAKVLYAAPSGAGTACSKDMPCSLSEALGKVTATQNIVKLAAGTYMTNVDIDGSARSQSTFTITVLAEPGTKLQAITATSPVLHLRNAAKMSLFDVELSGSTSDTVRLQQKGVLTLTRGKVVGGTFGIYIDDGTLTLQKSEVSGGSAQGIFVTKAASRVTIEQSQIVGSDGPGIELNDGELVLSRSLVRANDGGGVVIGNNRKATITNNFIVRNTGQGGISALQISAESQIDFNTIVDNVGDNTSTSAGGVICNRATLNLTGNLVFGNTGGQSGVVQEFGDCTYTGSFLLPRTAPIEVHPKFVSPTDYHLVATGTPATVLNALSGASCSGVDYDGDLRPQGGACELGADEIKQ